VSWRLIVSLRSFYALAFVIALLAPLAFANLTEDPRELLSKSFQQADLWNQGPVKLVAKVREDNINGEAQNLQYSVSWAGPEQWRAEWSAADLQQITILNNGKLSYVSNRPKPLWSTIWVETALAALDGGTPAGPYSFAPLDYENAKLHVSKKTINGTEARCVAFGGPPTGFFSKGYRADLAEGFRHRPTTLCIDPTSGHMLTADSDLGSFEYSDYTMFGSNSYPQTVKVSYMGKPMEEAQVTVTRGEQFPDSILTAPEKSTTVNMDSCADPATNFSPPRLDKSVNAKIPSAARKAQEYGVVWVLAMVDKDGSVEKTKVLSGPRALRTAATSAVQRYKYTPYVRCGQAVGFQQVVMVPLPPPPPTPSAPIDQRIPRSSYPTCFPCAP
jgi:Gram-negative bacterial TonB protein C-terminal